MKTPDITGETFDHKVAAIFADEASAKHAADVVRGATSVSDTQIFVVGPTDSHPGWELEPEDRGIWRTFVRSHLWIGLAGAVAGFLVFILLFLLGIGFVVASPLASVLIATGFGGIFGMMFAGLITLRPDHMPYISIAQSALRKGKYVLAVHARSAEQLQEAKAVLEKLDVKTIGTL